MFRIDIAAKKQISQKMVKPGIIFVRKKDDPLNFRNSRAQMFFKTGVLESFAQYLQKNICAGISF